MRSAAQAPEEFRCPISLEVMADPVILSTGQSYDRQSIQRWLDAGHRSCPQTKQQLEHEVRLIPNFALRSIIQRWAAAHCVPLPPPAPAAALAVAKAVPSVPGGAAALVRQLKSSDSGVVRDAIRELRSLAKCGRREQAAVAEAGGVAAILALLLLEEERRDERRNEIEENAVVALLNLSAAAADDDDGGAAKVGLVAEGALDAIAATLRREASSSDTKASAALLVTSLAMVEVNKASIGRRAEVVATLVKLVERGSTRARKDATIAIYSLAMLADNRPRIVAAGAVPVLLEASIAAASEEEGERSLALLDALAACAAGREAIRRRRSPAAVAALVAALAPGRGERSRESGAAVLAAVCEHPEWAADVGNAGAEAHLMASFVVPGSRPARKAAKLLHILRN